MLTLTLSKKLINESFTKFSLINESFTKFSFSFPVYFYLIT